ncbi:MAG: ABC transporter substrate-binding protein [Bacillota bacterium]
MKKPYKYLFIFFVFVLLFAVIAVYNRELSGFFGRVIAAPGNANEPKRLIVGCASDSISLDPINTTEMDSVKVTVNIYDTLVKYEKDGNKIIPCLAESWKSSEDGLTWVFNIRQGVRFHDGTILNAHDIVFNFQRWMDKENPYHTGQFSYWNYIFGGFPGFVKSVIALSDYSMEIKLSKPYAPFLSALAMPVFGIASPEAIKEHGKEFYLHPVGTGPFRFKSWEAGRSILLTRNNKYWGSVAKVDEVEFRVIQSGEERLKQLIDNNIHIADNLGPDDVAVIDNDPNLQLYLRPYFNVGYIALNNDKHPFDNRDVRIAIAHAINKEKLISEVFKDLARPAVSLIPPLFWGYNEDIKPYDYSIDMAKKLLSEAGYPNGFTIKLWVMDNPRNYFPKPLQVAEFIKESLKEINVEVVISTFNMDEYLKRIDNGEHEMALIGWTGDNIDPDNFLNTLLSSDNAKPGLAGNYSFYKNKEVDRLLAQARETTNMVFRKSIYINLLQIVNYDMPSVPLVHTMPVLAGRKNVRGYVPYITGVESLENVEILE